MSAGAQFNPKALLITPTLRFISMIYTAGQDPARDCGPAPLATLISE